MVVANHEVVLCIGGSKKPPMLFTLVKLLVSNYTGDTLLKSTLTGE